MKRWNDFTRWVDLTSSKRFWGFWVLSGIAIALVLQEPEYKNHVVGCPIFIWEDPTGHGISIEQIGKKAGGMVDLEPQTNYLFSATVVDGLFVGGGLLKRMACGFHYPDGTFSRSLIMDAWMPPKTTRAVIKSDFYHRQGRIFVKVHDGKDVENLRISSFAVEKLKRSYYVMRSVSNIAGVIGWGLLILSGGVRSRRSIRGILSDLVVRGENDGEKK